MSGTDGGGGVVGWAIRRPVSVAVGVILVVLFGAMSVAGIPIQLTPDVTVPTISVSTRWPGATPTEMESEILREQEEALKSLPGLVRMTSTAGRDSGTIDLELEVGASLDEALVRVTNLLSQVPDYPDSARQPVVNTADSAGPPLAVAIIQSIPPGRSVAEYRTWVDEEIIPRLERIEGVAGVRLIGGQERVAYVDFDPAAAAARGITLGTISRAVRAELRDSSAGDVTLGKRRHAVRTQVTPDSVPELEQLILATDAGGAAVRLGDVARAHAGLRKPDSVAMIDGHPSMALLLSREAGSNVLEVTQEIHREVQALQERFLAPEGLELRIVSDQTDYITSALDRVRDNLLLGGVLAAIVLLAFLRSVGASAVVILAIPVSVVATVLLMSLFGRTVNVVSLAGMAFAVGMVVDNSIVVLENIDTWRRRETSMRRAALLGTSEVWGAILASTCTTAAVFLPIIGWQDEVGELLRDVAIAISSAVFVSFVVSVTVIPSFAALVLKTRPQEDASRAADTPESRVVKAVRWIVSKPLRSVAVATVGIVGFAGLGVALVPPLEYLPTGNRNIVFGIVVPPPGYSVEEMQRVAEHVQDRIVPHLGVETADVPAIARTFFAGNPDQGFMGAVAEDPDRVSDMARFIRSVLGELPGVIAFANQANLFGRRLGGGRSIEVDIAGNDLVEIAAAGAGLMGAIPGALPGAQVRPVPGLDAGAPELQARPRREQTARLGLGVDELGLVVDAYIDGAIIGELGRQGAAKRDVILRASRFPIDSPAALAAAPVATPEGRLVPLGQLVSLAEVLGPTTIQRIERRRAITLQVSPADDIAFEDAIDVVRRTVNELRDAGGIPGGVDISYSGSAGKLDETKTRFGWVLLMAVVITFLLLAALFEDFLAPLAILVTVPLAGAGGIMALRLVNATLGAQPLDMMTALGFVILIGVVVNNAILVVDGALQRLRDGESLPDATAGAVQGRLRAIFMSTLTSLAGLLPLVLFPGSGSELYRGVGAVVLGGLALATLLTLFVVPSVFALIWRIHPRRRTVAPK